MKKILLFLSLFSLVASADVKISALPLGSAGSVGINDSFPYVNSVAGETERLTLDDLINLPAMVSQYAPIASPTFTGTCTATTFVGALTGHASLDLKASNNLSDVGTASTALNNILPSQTGMSGYVLGTNGSAAGWVTQSGGAPGGSSSDVQYNSSSSFAGDSSFTYDGAGNVTATTFIGALTGHASLDLKASNNLSDLGTVQTGMNNLAGAVTSGDYLRGNGTNVVMHAIVAGDVPTLNQNSTGSAGSLSQSLTANYPVIGNGTGIAVGLPSGNTTTFVTTTGSLVNGDCVEIDSHGNMVDAGAACGSGSGGITALTGGVTASGTGSVVATVVTNANLTGVITSVGNATSTGAQTGTGNTFVMQASPTITTPTYTTSITGPLHAGGTTASSSLGLESTSGSGTSDYINFLTASQSERMRITTAGNVGIGTTAPLAPLQVNAAASSVVVKSTTGTNTALQSFINTSGELQEGAESSSAGTTFTNSLAYAGLVGTPVNEPLQLATNGSVAVTINGNGSVGIGTTNPSAPLQVSGTAVATTFSGAGTLLTGTAASLTAGNVTTNANLTGVITSSGNATSTGAQTGTGNTFVMQTSPSITTPTFSVDATTPLLIGGSTSSSALGIESTSGSGSTDYINFLTASQSEKMRITSAGNVGIGTTAPTQKLSVAGTVQSTSGGFEFPDQAIQATNTNIDLLTNPWFQASISSNATSGYTLALGSGTAGTFTADVTAANTLDGNAQSGLMSYGASTTGTMSIIQTLTPGNIGAYIGVNMQCSAIVKTGSANWVFAVQKGGSIIESIAVPSSSTFQTVSLNFTVNSGDSSFGWEVYDSTASTAAAANLAYAYCGRATNLALGSNMSNWTSYTPTFVGLGTVTSSAFQYRQVGNMREIQGTAVIGTHTATLASMTMPLTDAIDTSVITLANTTSNPGTAVGTFSDNVDEYGSILTAPGTSTTLLYFGFPIESSGSFLVPQNGNVVISSSSAISIHIMVPIVGLTANQAGYRTDITPAQYDGTFTAGAAWSFASSSFGDASATSTLTAGASTNITGVTQANGANGYPGIVFTPPRIGAYEVCFRGTIKATTTNTVGFRVYDGTNVWIPEVDLDVGATTTSIEVPVTPCVQYNVTSTASVTLRAQLKSSAGTGTLCASAGAVCGISIKELTAPMPAPNLVGSVLSNSQSYVYRFESAVIAQTGTSSCAISSQDGSWISSVSCSSTGVVTVNFVSGAFTAAPNCTITVSQSAGSISVAQITTPATTSSLIYDTYSIAGSADNETVNIMCKGQH